MQTAAGRPVGLRQDKRDLVTRGDEPGESPLGKLGCAGED
jgi:hypothetical protein